MVFKAFVDQQVVYLSVFWYKKCLILLRLSGQSRLEGEINMWQCIHLL
jgi:hypothetical protein